MRRRKVAPRRRRRTKAFGGGAAALVLLSWSAVSVFAAAPPSAATHQALGHLAWRAGDLEAAQGHFERALEMRRASPGDPRLAAALTALGRVLLARGEVAEGREHCRRAARIYEKQVGAGLAAAWCWSCLGFAAHRQGDILRAEELHQRASALRRRLAPDSLDMADSFNSLANVALAVRDLERAEELYGRALALRRAHDPASLDLATTLGNLGIVAAYREDFAAAEDYFRRELEIKQKIAPRSFQTADNLTNLGNVLKNRGDLAAAEDFFRRALALHQELQPDGLRVAIDHYSLGNIAVERGDYAAADIHLGRAVSLREQLHSSSVGAALALRSLGDLRRRQGRAREAAALLRRAVDTLEGQIEALGGSHRLPGSFRERYEPIYRQAVAAMVAVGEGPEAFAYLEKSRARSLLGRLAERDATAPLSEGVERKLSSASTVGLEEALSVLDAGTVAMAYSVGEKKSLLFVVTPENGLERVVTIAAGIPRLGREVETLRRAVMRARHPRSAALAAFKAVSRRLYRLLVAPAADLVGTADRILVLPDGPLHLLPFGVLLDDGDPPRYLIETKPLASVLSATLYAELRRRRPPAHGTAPAALAIFADPSYPAAASGDPESRTAVATPFDLANLPHSRREALGIAALFPATRVRLYLGEAATMANAAALGGEARIVHFAVHGHLDDHSPFDSALVLSPGPEDDGLLRARDVFNGLRLDADLVVLSACKSGLGERRGGEGLIGLTRAFQYAGARSVIATLWEVDDRVTAELMISFYRRLREGASTAAALRGAKLEIMGRPAEGPDGGRGRFGVDAAAPVYWAGFELIGDWR